MSSFIKLTLLLYFWHGCLSPPPTSGQTPYPPFTGRLRQAPFCVDPSDEDVRNFEFIFQHHNKDNESQAKFVPVSIDTKRSPSGFIKNFQLTRISPIPIPEDHPYKRFHNFFHITITADPMSDGMEGLYVQAISAPLGVPFGEFVADFDCGDCKNKTSELLSETAIIPCKFRPQASYLHPLVFTIGGKFKPMNKFYESHFHFKYVDYPCFDVTFTHFLIIAVRDFDLKQFETYYSALNFVNIEAVGAPFPLYYGWEPSQLMCHSPTFSNMSDNWMPYRSQRAKVKFNLEYEKCFVEAMNNPSLAWDKIMCPPGPVTCGTDSSLEKDQPPKSSSQWVALREQYSITSTATLSGGSDLATEVYCYDCGEWEWTIGAPTWPVPPVSIDNLEITENYTYVTPKPIIYKKLNQCEEVRDEFGKNPDGGRNRTDKCERDATFDERLNRNGWRLAQTVLKIHGLAMIFTWTVASNCLIYSARFLKEATIMEKGTGCFGIGMWMWDHIFWLYIGFGSMWTGVGLFVMLPDLKPVCNAYDSKEVTMDCFDYGIFHEAFGWFAVVLYHAGYFTGFIRPYNVTVRKALVWYHCVSGYVAKYIGLLGLATAMFSKKSSIILLVSSELSFLVLVGIGTFIQISMDKKILFFQRRILHPVPEAIDTFIDPPYQFFRMILFPILIVTQLGFFGGMAFSAFSTTEFLDI
ncbi:unnamed protein product [Orchesella dallaii]|uniref:Uncharacterized protein n=1 Tax=Orchesella dallaii TaxID=48710 RepID=A0ABP1RL80_9HEXA